MASKDKPPPLEITRDTGALEAFAPVADKWYPAWVEGGVLTTVCGPVSYHLPVRYHDDRLRDLSSERQWQLIKLLRRYPKSARAGTE